MNRIPEPELMETPEQAEAYATADFHEVNRQFVEGLLQVHPIPESARVLDLGCGPADIPFRLLRKCPAIHVTAVDGSEAMLAWARERKEREGEGRLHIVEEQLPLSAPSTPFDVIISNSLLHHLHDPSILWEELKRQGTKGTRIHIMDLVRPLTPEAAREIVDAHAADEAEVLRQDFYHSLHAAFRLDEINEQLNNAGLRHLEVRQITDRHMLVTGEL